MTPEQHDQGGAPITPDHTTPSAPPRHDAAPELEILGLVVRMAPAGPTVRVDVPPDTSLQQVKLTALRAMGQEHEDSAQFYFTTRDGMKLDEKKTVREQRLNDFDFLHLGKLEDLDIRWTQNEE